MPAVHRVRSGVERRAPRISLALAAILIAASVAACNSGGTVTSAVATASPTATATATATAGNAAQTFTSAGGTLAIGPYANAAGNSVSLTSSWGANNQASSTFTGWLSSGNGDISPVTGFWTPYNLGATPVIYLELMAIPVTMFTQSPQLTFTTSSAVTGSACSIATLTTSGTWQVALTGGTLSNGNTTIVFTPQTLAGSAMTTIGNLGSANGPAYLALVCQ